MYENIEFVVACAGKSTRNYPHSKGIAHKCLMPCHNHCSYGNDLLGHKGLKFARQTVLAGFASYRNTDILLRSYLRLFQDCLRTFYT